MATVSLQPAGAPADSNAHNAELHVNRLHHAQHEALLALVEAQETLAAKLNAANTPVTLKAGD